VPKPPAGQASHFLDRRLLKEVVGSRHNFRVDITAEHVGSSLVDPRNAAVFRCGDKKGWEQVESLLF